MARTKKIVTVAPSEAEAHEAMRLFAEKSSQLKALEAKMELDIQKARDKYKLKIETLRLEKDDSFDKLKAFAEEHRNDLFTKRKSLDWTHGILGFRTSTPKVDKPSRITWANILEIIKKENLTRFLRTKEEINKEAIVECREDEEVMAKLKDVAGLEVVQTETFFVEPKEEEIAA